MSEVSQRVTIFDLWYDFECPWYFKLKLKFSLGCQGLNCRQIKYQNYIKKNLWDLFYMVFAKIIFDPLKYTHCTIG